MTAAAFALTIVLAYTSPSSREPACLASHLESRRRSTHHQLAARPPDGLCSWKARDSWPDAASPQFVCSFGIPACAYDATANQSRDGRSANARHERLVVSRADGWPGDCCPAALDSPKRSLDVRLARPSRAALLLAVEVHHGSGSRGWISDRQSLTRVQKRPRSDEKKSFPSRRTPKPPCVPIGWCAAVAKMVPDLLPGT